MSLCLCGCGQPAPIWSRNETRRNRVRGQAARYLPGHHYATYPTTPAAQRFWQKVDRTAAEGCWTWLGYTMPNGYGTFYGPERRKVLAHRFSYELQFGSIPQGLDLDHLCRNRRCVNPAHLEPVTRGVNLARARTAKEQTA